MEKSILITIQETIIKYADVISQITQAQVEIMDKNFIRIASTGTYSQGIGEVMDKESQICQQVFKTSESIIVGNPRQHPACKGCPNLDNCNERLVIASPITFNQGVEGVILLFAITHEEEVIITNNLKVYQNFIKQIADFIGIKAKECNEEQISRMYTNTLANIVDKIEQCVIVLHKDNTIKSINSSTKKHLKVTDKCVGEYLDLKSTGDDIHGENEFRMKIQKNEFYIVGQIHNMYIGTQSSVQILIFREQKQLKSNSLELNSDFGFWSIDDIIGNSNSMKKLKNDIRRFATSMSTVFIKGESGTGKELVATAIWKESERRDETFVPVNCAAIPDSLIESELFGYVKGAFTGANPKGRIGKFELANNGVLFLDEIGDIPIYLQAKLLRVLQEQKITRIGSNNEIEIDVRIITATNKDIPELIRENKFREDLYYRLNVIPMKLPPLRERREDISDLVDFFIKTYVKKFDKSYNKTEETTLTLLRQNDWPGNVRELENVVEYMINMMNYDGILNDRTLPESIFKKPLFKETDENPRTPVHTLKEIERREIEKALSIYGRTTKGKKIAAQKLCISVSTLYRKLEQWK